MENKLKSKLKKTYPHLDLLVEDKKIIVFGKANNFLESVNACKLVAVKYSDYHVVNDCNSHDKYKFNNTLEIVSEELSDQEYDVVIIGGGISGTSVARELARYDLKICLLEKENDLALEASSHNDGEIHVGVDLNKKSIKAKYTVKANRMFDKLCDELGVEFKRVGQLALFSNSLVKPYIKYYINKKIKDGVDDTKLINKKEIYDKEKYLNKKYKFAMYNSCAGIVSPYNLVVAYMENAIDNGVDLYLDTAVIDFEIKNSEITKVKTTRGDIKTRLVINASGVSTENIASLADDRFFSIHYRKGTDLIFDKHLNKYIKTVSSAPNVSIKKSNTKGGGIIPTIDGNILLGPTSVEVSNPYDYDVSKEEINNLLGKFSDILNKLEKKDVISYFSGVRACSYEEDFIIQWGRNTKNIYHIAAIQSPGLTTAPLVAKEVSKEISEYFKCGANKNFNPVRKAYLKTSTLANKERDNLIKSNKDYGEIICRCEEITKGEIIDALSRGIKITSIDMVKRRVRPGMGRCQGGFCSALVHKIIAEYYQDEYKSISKNSKSSYIVEGDLK